MSNPTPKLRIDETAHRNQMTHELAEKLDALSSALFRDRGVWIDEFLTTTSKIRDR